MKYDLSNKKTRFAQRTLTAFSDNLFKLLEVKAYEDIAVNELCEISNYPRATFYNYFDDIYDLLDYCWLRMSMDIKIDDYQQLEPEERMNVIFKRIYNFLLSQKGKLNAILKHNSIDGKLVDSLCKYLKKQIREIMSQCNCTERYEIPYEMVSEHYANTIMLVLEWSFLRKEPISQAKAKECIAYLLKKV